MRKKIYTLALLLCASALGLSARAASFLTVTDKDGQQTSFALSTKPVVTFTAESLVLTAGAETVEYPLTAYRKFSFADGAATAIEKAGAAHPVFAFGDALTATGLQPGTRVAVYSLGGVQVASATASAAGTVSIPLSSERGVLVVKAGKKVFKFRK